MLLKHDFLRLLEAYYHRKGKTTDKATLRRQWILYQQGIRTAEVQEALKEALANDL